MANYVGLIRDLVEECTDICEQEDQIPLEEQQDCFSYIRANMLEGSPEDFINHGFYYAYDFQVQTCFSFDPRADTKMPLIDFLPGRD